MVGWLLDGGRRQTIQPLPVEFTAVGWESFQPDADGKLRHPGTPSDLDATYGVIVRVTDTDNNEVIDHFTAYARGFESWDEWWEYIRQIIEMYGMELA